MQLTITREDSLRNAKAYIFDHDDDSLTNALANDSCQAPLMIVGLLYMSGHNYVSANDDPTSIDFAAGPTHDTMKPQATFSKATRTLTGPNAAHLSKVYAVLSVIEHELGAATYLPSEMRQARVGAVCDRLGIDQEFFQTILRKRWA